MKKLFQSSLLYLCFGVLLLCITKSVSAQMICCNGCYGGVCQVQANCVFGGQTCNDECSGQGASCGNTCTYDSNCSGYPNESCVGGACLANTPTPTRVPPTSAPVPPTTTAAPQITTIPTPTNTALSCPYCGNPIDPWINNCNSCYTSNNTGYELRLGQIYVANTSMRSDDYVYDLYTCSIKQNGTSCGIPYVYHNQYGYTVPQTVTFFGCWPSGCGPYPPGYNAPPTSTPTPTPIPTYTPSPTFIPTPTACPNRCTGNICGSFTVGGCSYNCDTRNCSATQFCQNNVCNTYSCNDSCPSNGFNCGGGLWCSGLAGNVCRAPGNPSSAICDDIGYISPTPDPCGNGLCSATESCNTCGRDCCPFVTGGVTNTPVPTPAYTFTVTNPCIAISTTDCETTVTWNTTNYTNVTVTTSTGTVGSGPTGSETVTIGTSSCVTYYLKSEGSTITSETVCPQRRWIKLKNASYQTRASYLVNPIPDTVQAYDADDTTDAQFIIGEAGPVTARSITPYPTTISSSDWVKEGYTPRIIMDKAKILSYIKSRKNYERISGSEISTIHSGSIYTITDPTLMVTSTTPFDGKDVVIIVDGTITFNIAGGAFSPTNGHVAFIADTIHLSSGSNYVSTINALLIADTITTGSVDNTGVKVIGNLITRSLVNERTQSGSSNTKPSIFISVDPQTYLSLLPFISTAKYEWKQLN